MERDIQSVLSSIERRLDEFEKRQAIHVEAMDALQKQMRGVPSMLDLKDDQIDNLKSHASKMSDVYYHVFPDRAARDQEFAQQMDRLKSGQQQDRDADT